MKAPMLVKAVPKGPDYQTIEGLKQHPLYGLLTGKQQDFLISYLETKGDRSKAIIAAGFKNRRSDVAAMRMLRSAYVRKLISIYYGYEFDQAPMTKGELSGLISARLRDSKVSDAMFSRLTDSFIELNFLKRPKMGRPTLEEAEEVMDAGTQSVNDLVHQIEQERKTQQGKE